MRVRLSQIRTVEGAIERYFALLAAALGTDAAVHRGTESFLFADFTDRATQGSSPS
jgi:hypothetical protein